MDVSKTVISSSFGAYPLWMWAIIMAILTLSDAIRNSCVELFSNQGLRLASQEILLLPGAILPVIS
jgi:hypothetical protein